MNINTAAQYANQVIDLMLAQEPQDPGSVARVDVGQFTICAAFIDDICIEFWVEDKDAEWVEDGIECDPQAAAKSIAVLLASLTA